MSPDPKAEVTAEWKAGIAASKSSRKSIYTAAAGLVGLLAATPAAGKLVALCAQVGLAGADAICGVPEAKITLAVGGAIAGVMDFVVQLARNYLKHKLGWAFLP